jgi:hypothetical protein
VHITQDTRHISICARDSQENARIANSRILHARHHTHANNRPHAVEDDDEPPLSIPVSHLRGCEHLGCSQHIRRETHNLAQRNRIAHIVSQNDRQKVHPRVRNDVVEEAQPCEFPDLPVTQVKSNAGPRQFIRYSVAAVSLDAREDDRRFSFRDERLASDGRGLRRLIRERYDRKVSHHAQDDRDRAFLPSHKSSLLL